ncbi:MAG: polyprenol monophosphomannose synthase [Candidatus Altiarchaeota archaeon]
MKASVIVPTYNEANNLRSLVKRIAAAADVEIIVVDDASPDGTGNVADELARKYQLKVIHRSGKLGLASAIIEGLKAASCDIVGVIDADLSHPPELLPRLIEPIMSGKADLVLASRYADGGGEENWPFWRKITSRGAVMLARPLTPLRDSMTGYFFMRKSVIDGVPLDAVGFKICLEVQVKGKYNKAVEVPYTFHNRKLGKSKLNSKEYTNYIRHLIKLYMYRLRGARRAA